MKSISKKALLTVTLSIFSLCATFQGGYCSERESGTTERKTLQAADQLEALGVPLQKDPDGIVRWIEARNGELNDEAMSLLPMLPKLEWLEIGNGTVTLAGLKNLEKCVSLKRLYVHDINLKGGELAWLSALKKLEALSLQRTAIDGKFLKHLNTVDSLKVLNLSENSIDDDDMDGIARFKNLEVLALADTQITGNGIGKLTEMNRLNELNISNCAVMDYDLNYFLSMPNLRIVYAEGCNLNDMAIGSVVMRFPMLAIFR